MARWLGPNGTSKGHCSLPLLLHQHLNEVYKCECVTMGAPTPKNQHSVLRSSRVLCVDESNFAVNFIAWITICCGGWHHKFKAFVVPFRAWIVG
jgi:hypothetical protein